MFLARADSMATNVKHTCSIFRRIYKTYSDGQVTAVIFRCMSNGCKSYRLYEVHKLMPIFQCTSLLSLTRALSLLQPFAVYVPSWRLSSVSELSRMRRKSRHPAWTAQKQQHCSTTSYSRRFVNHLLIILQLLNFMPLNALMWPVIK